MTDPILDVLDPEQRQVAILLDRPLVVLAEAGTRKTWAIMHRVAHAVREGRYAPATTFAVTFTTRATGELKSRLAGLGVHKVSTRIIHAAVLSQCRYFWPMVYGSEFPELLDNPFSLMGRAVNRVPGNTDTNLVRDLIGEIGQAKSSNVSPGRYARLARGCEVTGVEPERVAQVTEVYEKHKTSAGVVDFNDIPPCTAALLVEHPVVAEQTRDAYRYFVVDEHQGVSAIQHRSVSLWVDGRPDTCVVGDPQQAIHGFVGARADCLTGFVSKHPGARQARLMCNYRSSPGIVQLANRIVCRHPNVGDLYPTRLEGPPPESYADDTEEDEARATVTWLEERHAEGTPWGECAVLRRINAQSPVSESVLDAARIPYQVKGTDRSWERPEVRDAVNWLYHVAQRDPGTHPRELLDEVLVELRWSPEAPSGMGVQRERREPINSLAQMIRDVQEAAPNWTVPESAAWLNDHANLETPSATNAVMLAIMHAVKGLEWNAVIVVGVREGMVPLALSQEKPAPPEERRLLYVAVTRARRRPWVSWLGKPSRGRGVRSRFLTGLVSGKQVPTPRIGRSGCSSVRSRTCFVYREQLTDAAERKPGRHAGCEVPSDEELLAALKAWRLEAANAAPQPAFVIFTDTTLQATAEAEPVDRAQLLRTSGIGTVKADRLGTDALRIVAKHGARDVDPAGE